MRIIGVIDLKDGLAVHARGGRRHLYAPVDQSAGAAVKGNPLALGRHYVDTVGLSEIYVADLDAIASGTPHAALIRAISSLGASLWVDAGISGVDGAKAVAATGAQTIVVGLETLASVDALADICALTTRPVAFSLDLRAGTPLSGALKAESPETIARLAMHAGAKTIIVLDVARVGMSLGPDLEMLKRIQSAVPDVPLFAGGGVRTLDDLRQLARIACAGALVATAFHDGVITRAELATIDSSCS